MKVNHLSLLFQDAHTNETDTWISIDAKQDCLDFQSKLMPNGVLYTYKRAFDSCDEDDYVIQVPLLGALIYLVDYKC